MTTGRMVTDPWVLPAGREVLPAGSNRDVWLAARRGGSGSSDIAILMGVSHYRSEFELWLDKTGRIGDEPMNWAMQRGVWLEPHVVDYFAEQTDLWVCESGLVVHRDEPVLRATPDRLTGDGGVLEVKTVARNARVASEWRYGGIARHAYVQGQWQLLVTGRSHVWFAAYILDAEPLIRGPVERDEPLIERMRDRALSWWADHVETGIPPPVDLATVTAGEIRLRWPVEKPGTTKRAEWPASVRMLLAERAELKAAEKAAKDRADEVDAALKVMTGAAEALLLGDEPVLTLKSAANNPSVDPALETDYPEVWARYIKRGKSRRIHVCRGWDQL